MPTRSYPLSPAQKRDLDLFVVASLGALVVLAGVDALRSEGPSTVAEAVPTVPGVSTKQEAVTVPRLTPEQEIERVGNTWAPIFAAGPLPRACRYETQPLCERIACQRVGGSEIRDCTPPTSAFRNSFFGATVQDVEIRGHRAAARFSNGEMVELFGDGGTWSIHRIGGNAGRRFFE
jgi:hypothetical protein